MTDPNASRCGGESATPPEGITLTAEQARVAQYPLLRELHSLCESAAKEVHGMHESNDLVEEMPIAIDTRNLFTWIDETVDVLDALGWRASVDRERAKYEKQDEAA